MTLDQISPILHHGGAVTRKGWPPQWYLTRQVVQGRLVFQASEGVRLSPHDLSAEDWVSVELN